MRLTFDDLFAFDTGLCHLRLYAADDSALVGLVVELDDNPGVSVVNGAKALAARVAAVFGARARLFLIFPQTGTAWTEVLDTNSDERPDFRLEVPRSEIESLVGRPVAACPAGACTAEALGGSNHPLLRLIPPEQKERHLLADMEPVAVADLPWPHNPSRCAHSERFNALRRLYDPGFDGHVPAGAHFFLSLGKRDFGCCEYHGHDWVSIAAASLELLRRLPPDADHAQIAEAVSLLLPAGPDQHELLCLFSHPITWAPGESSITNGQHRSCALRAAGAPECAVLAYGEEAYVPVGGDPRQAARSALAAYWVDRLHRA